MNKPTNQEVVHAFANLYYFSNVWNGNTKYRGVPIAKCPFDMWIYGEIIYETKPTLIIETGTWNGGSALWLADNSNADVWSIDINSLTTIPEARLRDPFSEALTFITGSSTEVELPEIDKNQRVMVILDSDHSADHVYAELERFSPLVTPGCYLIVEDTNVKDEHNDAKAGLDRWLPDHPEFVVDPLREKFFLSFNPGGYLRRRLA